MGRGGKGNQTNHPSKMLTGPMLTGAIALYEAGASLTDLTEIYSFLGYSTIRRSLVDAGVTLRSRADGVRLATQGKPSPLAARRRPPRSQEWSDRISAGRRRWADENAAGISQKPNGYVEATRGENKGRGLHRVIMEQRLGRRLSSSECVHHIDRDRANNDPSNLIVMSRSEHTRLHRRANG